MTPKEKAKELVNKMFNCDNSTPEESMAMLYPHAKQCALIAVNEIIDDIDKSLMYSNIEIEWWQEVKEEIQKL